MASTSFSSFSCSPSQDYDRPDLESIKELVTIVNEYFLEFLACSESWNSLKFQCISKINIRKQEFFEFSEHSVLSNLYWGIESIESAIQEKCAEEIMNKLKNSEKLLQAPAMLDEDGVTAGIQNSYLICCSYFYLSLVRKLQNDESQVALHFLQAIMVSPRTVRKEFAPRLCADLFGSKIGSEGSTNEGIREIARRNKNWLMYYQVMLYGQTPQWQCKSRNGSFRSDQLQNFRQESRSRESAISSVGQGQFLEPYKDEKVHPFDMQEDTDYVAAEKSMICRKIRDDSKASQHLDRCTSIKCLQEVLIESQSDTPTSTNSCCSYYVEEENEEENMDDTEISLRTIGDDDLQPENCDRMVQASCFTVNQICTMMVLPPVPQRTARKVNEAKISNFSSGRFCSSISDFDLSIMEVRNKKKFNDIYMHSGTGKDSISNTELMTILEKAITKLCFPEGLAKCEEDYAVELTAIYKMLNSKKEMKYTILQDIILDQLLTAISSSEEEKVRRASMAILISIVSVNKSAVEYIRNKGLKLCDLATALKQNVHEAAVLIYLINPPPTEIKTLELLPTLMEIVCTSNSYKEKVASEFLTPPGASLMIVEILVTAFDSDTNNMHLAAINSPRIISRMLDVARDHNVEECISMTNILIKCMQFDGQCRKYIMQIETFAPFKRLLQSSDKRAKFTALQFFHEFLCMPRSSNITLLQWIRKEGSDDIMQILLQCIQNLQPDYQLLAANLLLQLDILENSSGKSTFMKDAMQIILKSVASEENSTLQQLATSILANIGGTYTWSGEPYTVALLAKKAGLTSLKHWNMIRNFDWSDQCLQDAGIEPWCSKIAKCIISIGKPVFQALEKGLRSKIKRVSRDSLIAVTWIGCEIAKYPNGLRNSASEILLNGIEQFLHPGMELEERLLSCLCIYNYTSGKGMQKLIHFSEGVRESLRRFSSVTWMAEELHRVADFYLPNRSRISCVHTQVLEAKHNYSGAVTALIYYKGLLYSGYSDGSIKVWDVKQQSAILIWDLKEHKKTVTCFSLYEPGESLLTGSADKTIRVWQLVHRKLECIEVISLKESIQKIETFGQMIFAVTQGYGIKAIDSSRIVKDVCKSKKVKSITTVQGKLYIGCMDSSIQELAIANNREREIKSPIKSWMMHNKPINSIVVHKDWLYSASLSVEGSKIKEWRTNYKPQMTIQTDKGRNVQLMGVVEDFIYLNCSSSSSSLQIWLRGTQQKVGRISAGSKITSLLTANDIVLCGTEKGLIKGWIPL